MRNDMSSDETPSPDSEQLQLELWLSPPQGSARPLTEAEARANLLAAPGWWPLLRGLFTNEGFAVTACHENRYGELVLELSLASGDDETAHEIVGSYQASARTMCVCCSSRRDTEPVQLGLSSPIHILCPDCGQRFRAGESVLEIADDYFRLDGSSRARPLLLTRTAPAVLKKPPAAADHPRPITTLPPDELRALVAQMRATMRASVVGHDLAVSTLSLLAASHVGGGLAFGPRVLVLGPSGSGKNTLVSALLDAMAPWQLPVASIECSHMTSPGWSLAPSVGSLLAATVGQPPWPDPERTHRAVVVLDELHSVRIDPALLDLHGNTLQHRRDLLASLQGLAGGASVSLGESGAAWPSQKALIIGLASFEDILDLSRPPTLFDLTTKAGMPIELISRLAQEMITLEPLTESALVEMIRHAPQVTTTIEMCRRLGYDTLVHGAALRRAAHVVAVGHDRSTPRTAIALVVSALRHALMLALDDPTQTRIEIAPDALEIPPDALRKKYGRGSPPGGYWGPLGL